ncbi:ribonucleotide reductase of class Ia (aerobic) beta subunit [Cyanophage S-RIM12 isolate W1_08_0910]|uniref:ribonucleoside-diphosphate reductase n=3 Tax=Brizovirus TaxID=2733098 RepID=A0A1D7SR06_9CAUD|nr:ribonucleoside diphosphate reductase small subunit [Cyanophage S-RIM12 isolate RW_06_0310]YP_009779588.1 ribonucleoside diphosphate reductase small subunit [Cyanophage S-RIM12 isolate W1_08_0910]AOO15451.1 ribonucleotide reductase of class Ia (aerobic) beta subunit [Cyanophage S-RIM12_Np_15_0310]AOO16091.1 ribonucleotide reductase of class Ia (aerobic) beta subunit [Cyanophage S-RIM12_RW_04_0310]AOO19311.1 ribonucleotide reductase of class Ia (aerobic) beta subunit [Cyanophage S-RIM12_WH_05_
MSPAKSELQGMTVFNKNKVDTKKQPMFFGQPLGVQRYDSYKYPVFDKLTQQQLGYFWRPEEVSLQKDRADYQTLSPEQKHIFTSNLKYQIMLDSVQGRGPGMAFSPYCSLPELEACMNVWQFMEMIHSRSYTYIIKNVYSDPTEVFDTILDDERILDRASSVTESYDDFINHAHQYDTGTMWELARDGHYAGQFDRRELKRKLYRAVANVNILEGIRFYTSFACSFAFGENKLMEGSAKILSLIARDESQHLNLTQNILRKWSEGDDPEMEVIAREEQSWVMSMFQRAVDEEKMWAEYLFKNGSMIGLNERLLHNYVEWIANRRMKAIGIKPMFDIPAKNNPLPWTEHWLNSKGQQNAPQETEIESYVIGGIKQDVQANTFAGFSL